MTLKLSVDCKPGFSLSWQTDFKYSSIAKILVAKEPTLQYAIHAIQCYSRRPDISALFALHKNRIRGRLKKWNDDLPYLTASVKTSVKTSYANFRVLHAPMAQKGGACRALIQTLTCKGPMPVKQQGLCCKVTTVELA